jgi:hypothetical protein
MQANWNSPQQKARSMHAQWCSLTCMAQAVEQNLAKTSLIKQELHPNDFPTINAKASYGRGGQEGPFSCMQGKRVLSDLNSPPILLSL